MTSDVAKLRGAAGEPTAAPPADTHATGPTDNKRS